jgi:hypothetical protein
MFIKSVLLVLYVYAQEKIERVTTQSSILDNWPDMHIVLHKLNVCFQTSCVFNLANFYNILFSNTCSIYGAIWIGLLTFPLLLGIHEYKPIRQWDIYLDWQVQFQSFSVLSLYCKNHEMFSWCYGLRSMTKVLQSLLLWFAKFFCLSTYDWLLNTISWNDSFFFTQVVKLLALVKLAMPLYFSDIS